MSQPHLPTNDRSTSTQHLDFRFLSASGHTGYTGRIFNQLAVAALIFTGTISQGLYGIISSAPAARAENPAHVQQLLRTNECVDCDLRGSYLSGLDLTGANLAGSQLRGANLTGTNLSRANLTQADLSRTLLTNTHFQGANLGQASLRNAETLDFCRLDSSFFADVGNDICNTMRLFVNLDTAICPDETTDTQGSLDELLGDRITELLEFCSEKFPTVVGRNRVVELFGEPNFRGANLTNANLFGMNLNGVNLSYANLSGATLTNAQLDQAILLHATVDEGQRANLATAILSDEDLGQVLENMMRQEAIARRETDARYTVETINRYQQAQYIENGRFIGNIEDLELGLELVSNRVMGTIDSSDYQYSIRYATEDFVIHTAESTTEDLKNYFGLVYLHTFPGEEGNEIGTLTEVCESDEPGLPIPFNITLPAIDIAVDELTSSCPSGFHNAYRLR